jgi:hypothetical protein
MVCYGVTPNSCPCLWSGKFWWIRECNLLESVSHLSPRQQKDNSRTSQRQISRLVPKDLDWRISRNKFPFQQSAAHSMSPSCMDRPLGCSWQKNPWHSSSRLPAGTTLYSGTPHPWFLRKYAVFPLRVLRLTGFNGPSQVQLKSWSLDESISCKAYK